MLEKCPDVGSDRRLVRFRRYLYSGFGLGLRRVPRREGRRGDNNDGGGEMAGARRGRPGRFPLVGRRWHGGSGCGQQEMAQVHLRWSLRGQRRRWRWVWCCRRGLVCQSHRCSTNVVIQVVKALCPRTVRVKPPAGKMDAHGYLKIVALQRRHARGRLTNRRQRSPG